MKWCRPTVMRELIFARLILSRFLSRSQSLAVSLLLAALIAPLMLAPEPTSSLTFATCEQHGGGSDEERGRGAGRDDEGLKWDTCRF